MILVISGTYDLPTDDVIDWLHFSGQMLVRITPHTKVEVKDVELMNECMNFSLIIKNKKSFITIRYSDIKSIWYRRGKINYAYAPTANTIYWKQVQQTAQREIDSILHFVHFLFSIKNNSINYYTNSTTNKLQTLFWAMDVGLDISPTFIGTNKKDLTAFRENATELITKGIQEGSDMEYSSGFMYGAGTKSFTDLELANIEDVFFPSLFQKKIDKLYELRIFYLKGNFYSMAIFSQLNEKTCLDFRNYDDELPNRNVPYVLPPPIKEKLSALMQKINLNCGSIDMVVTKNKEYLFLEVNPIGQFTQVSEPCNFYLEKKIFQSLNGY